MTHSLSTRHRAWGTARDVNGACYALIWMFFSLEQPFYKPYITKKLYAFYYTNLQRNASPLITFSFTI